MAYMDILGAHFMADVTVTFNQPYRVEKIEQAVSQVPGVEAVEGWGFTGVEILDEQDELVTNLFLFAPPAGSTLLRLISWRGAGSCQKMRKRWLSRTPSGMITQI